MEIRQPYFEYDADGDVRRVWGFVYGNPKFPDGTFIATSRVKDYDPKTHILHTKNSEYLLTDFT